LQWPRQSGRKAEDPRQGCVAANKVSCMPRSRDHGRCPAANQRMKLTGAAILVSRGMKVLQAAPAAYPYR
jgi:hypothetical protein